MELYYIEKKQYFTGSNNYEYQVADGGETPLIFFSKDKAIKLVLKMRDVSINLLSYQETISSENNPAVKEDCLWASRLETFDRKGRMELRVYKFKTL